MRVLTEGQMGMDTEFDSFDEIYNNREDAKREIMDEIFEYQENAARCEEDGWFYSDDDEINE